MGLPGQKCLSGVRTNGLKWHVRLGQMSGQSAMGWGAVWPGKDQVRTPIGVAGTSRSSCTWFESRATVFLYFLFWRNAQLPLLFNFHYNFRQTQQLRNQANFQQVIFLGIFGDFWPDFGGLTSCPDKLRESPKVCRKIRTNLGKFGDLCPDKSVQPLDRPSSG